MLKKVMLCLLVIVIVNYFQIQEIKKLFDLCAKIKWFLNFMHFFTITDNCAFISNLVQWSYIKHLSLIY